MRPVITEMTQREREEHQMEMEIAEKQAEFTLRRAELDLEVRKLEAKWTSWLKLPTAVILLPVKFIMALAIPISVITKKDLPDAYWDFLKG